MSAVVAVDRGGVAAVVLQAEALCVAIGRLCGSPSMRSLARLIEQLGIGELVARAAAALSEVVARLRRWLARVAGDLAGIAGLLGLLRPLIRGIGELAGASAGRLKELGLAEVAPALDPVRELAAVGGRWIERGERALTRLPIDAIPPLCAALEGVADALDGLVKVLREPPASATSAALPPGGAG